MPISARTSRLKQRLLQQKDKKRVTSTAPANTEIRIDAPIEVKYFIGSHTDNQTIKRILLKEIHSHCKGAVTPSYA